MNKIQFSIIACALMLGGASLTSCSDDRDYIPPALDELEGDIESEFNEFDFTPHQDGEPYTTYRGLVMAGYQGWFGTPGDGCSHASHDNTAWYHYRENDMFKPGVGRNSIDMWPDMSEYDVKYPTDFKFPDGSQAYVYSAYDESSVSLHFKWMKEYGIDGVFMQRFVGEVINNPEGKDHFDTVLRHAMNASDTYDRAIAVMYDLGGYNPMLKNAVVADARNIYDQYASTRKYYLHENGKPMIALWGVGFDPKERNYSNSDVQELVDQLKEMGYSIMLGTSTYWRSGGGDTYSGDITNLHKLVKSVDVVMPWYVGRYGNESEYNFGGLEGGFAGMVGSDLNWCRLASAEDGVNVNFAPLCFAGASDRNMHPQNSIVARNNGDFYWTQIYNSIKQGCEMLYIAMFDEIDEGTAIYKVMNKSEAPINRADEDYYVIYNPRGSKVTYKDLNGNSKTSTATIILSSVEVDAPTDGWAQHHLDLNIEMNGIDDGQPTDHYLWLTGQARKMLNGEIKMTRTQPVR